MSESKKNTLATSTSTKTMAVVTMVSLRVGQVTFDASERTSWKKVNRLGFAMVSV